MTLMPALKENKKYTIEDIMALPENEHAELIDGQIYYQAAPSRKHQDISGELYAAIHDYIKKNGGHCNRRRCLLLTASLWYLL